MDMRTLINLTESARSPEAQARFDIGRKLAALRTQHGEMDEGITDGLGALGPMQGYSDRSTAGARHLADLAQRSAENKTKSALDVALTEPQRELLAITEPGRVGYNMHDVAASPEIKPGYDIRV